MSFSRQANLDRDMLNVGNDIIPERKDRSTTRQRKGECETCGQTLFKIGKILGKRTPLTIEGKVYKGRCLHCKPLEGYMRKPAPVLTPAAVATSPIVVGAAAGSAAVRQQEQTENNSSTASPSQLSARNQRTAPKSPNAPREATILTTQISTKNRDAHAQAPAQQIHGYHHPGGPSPPLEFEVGHNPHLAVHHNQQRQQEYHSNVVIPPTQQPQSRPIEITPHGMHNHYHHQIQMQQYHQQMQLDQQGQEQQQQQQQFQYPLPPAAIAPSGGRGLPRPIFSPHHDVHHQQQQQDLLLLQQQQQQMQQMQYPPQHYRPHPAMMMTTTMNRVLGTGVEVVGGCHHPNFVGKTLEVHDQSDDVSVMSALTMDVRLMNIDRSERIAVDNDDDFVDDDDDDGPAPAIRRRPGPEGGDESNKNNSSNNNARRSRGASSSFMRTIPTTNKSMKRFRDALPPTLHEEEGVQSTETDGIDGGDGEHETPVNQRGNNTSTLDADGYPIASNTFGWDRQADMLPVGVKMDTLLSPTPRTQPKTNSPPSNLKSQDHANDEIQFSPPFTLGHADRFGDRKLTAPHSGEYDLPAGKFEDFDGRVLSPRGPTTMASIMSGPSYQLESDDDIDFHQREVPPSALAKNKSTTSAGTSFPSLQSADPSVASSPLQARPSARTNLSDASPPLMQSRGRADSARGVSDPSALVTMPVVVRGVTMRGDKAASLQTDRNDRRCSARIRSQRECAVGDDAVGDLSQPIDQIPDQPTNYLHPAAETAVAKGGTTTRTPISTTSNQGDGQQKAPPKEKKRIKKERQSRTIQRNNVDQLPNIIHTLSLEGNGAITPSVREKALQDLATILASSGPKAKEFIIENKCVEVLTRVMWNDIDNARLQDAAFQCILAMAATHDSEAVSDMLSYEDSVCDAALFSMQMNSSVSDIQLKGCCIFACLASASSKNKHVSDGSLSGAVTMVVNAMASHIRDIDIQKAGIQALYNQCYLSVHAEANKRTLMDAKLENGMTGVGVVLRCLELGQEDYLTVERGCCVCWCLTSSEDLWKAIVREEFSDLHNTLIPLCQKHMLNPHSTTLIEAIIGTVANLARDETKHIELRDADALTLMMDSLHYHPGHDGIKKEAMLAIANISADPKCGEELVDLGAVEIAAEALSDTSSDAEHTSNALRAIVTMAVNADAKKAVSTNSMIKVIDAKSTEYDSAEILEMCCAFIATITAAYESIQMAVDNGAIAILLRALDKTPEEKVTCAVLSALRNISSSSLLTGLLIESGAIATVVNAMDKYPHSNPIQTNACCFLWNVAQSGGDCRYGEVKFIVKAMQAHLESATLLEMACGALWNIVELSSDGKKQVIENGAIEVLAAAMMMHPTTTATLSQACGVLSNITTDGSVAQAIVNAQGVTIVAEAMRNNSDAIELLELGCLTLRNLVYALPDRVEEAGTAIATVINAMQESVDSVGFHREACNLIWILSSHSPKCQSKALALDGLSVLMKCMEQYSDNQEIQQAALAAFNQLASSPQEDLYDK